MNRHYYGAIATLVGMIIGAGVFGIPYVVAQAGLANGIILMLVLGLSALIINLYAGEITLRTNEKHQLPGYAEIYLGKYGKLIAMLGLFLGLYGALTAYVIGEAETLSVIFRIEPVYTGLAFFVIMAFIIFSGWKSVERSEVMLGLIYIILFVIMAILAFFSGKFNAENFPSSSFKDILLPYGVILFAYAGLVAIPEMRVELARSLKQMKKAIIWGSAIPAFVYIVFTIAVLGVTGPETTPVASIGLGKTLGTHMILLGNLFAVFAMATSFLAVGLAIKEIYMFDYKLNKNLAWFLTMIVPLALLALGAKSFTNIIGIAGAIGFGAEGILVVLMHKKAKKLGDRRPEYVIPHFNSLSTLFIILFVLGAVYQVFF